MCGRTLEAHNPELSDLVSLEAHQGRLSGDAYLSCYVHVVENTGKDSQKLMQVNVDRL